jgi:hypothetical protein
VSARAAYLPGGRSQQERKPDQQNRAPTVEPGRKPPPSPDASSQVEKGSKPSPNRPAGKDQRADDKLRLEARLVSIRVSVADRFGRFVTGLSKDDFEVFDDGVKQEIAVFLRHQYVIGFYPTGGGSAARWHNVQIRVKAPAALGRLKISYKKSYESFR